MKPTARVDRKLATASLRAIAAYRRTTRRTDEDPGAAVTSRARRALLHLGGDPARSSRSLAHYEHARFGPFLGVSDEGSAALQIREAAYDSPKAQALPQSLRRDPLAIGLALDAERLGGVGETAVGPDEYADVWLGCVDRLLVTTNIGTRVNMRVYRREPIVLLKSDSAAALDAAKAKIAEAFKPFIETPDQQPRPLTVFIDIPRYVQMPRARRLRALTTLARYVSSGEAAGRNRAPPGQRLGLTVWVGLGEAGRDESIDAIDLAAAAGIDIVCLDGVKRKIADKALSLAGLLDYFSPELLGPILRAARDKKVSVRTANLPDTNTIARSTWVGLTTARNFGANLGKYGCFPLTLTQTDHVVEQIQRWLPDWSAAPVFFVDQGVLQEGSVDVEKDLMRGIKAWLRVVAKHRVRVVLIDTIDKATGNRLLKSPQGPRGYLGMRQIEKIEQLARELRIKVLWAGGLGLADAYAMGKLGVFGIYVTTAAATTIAVAGSYTLDPSLAGLKEPSREAVLRTKTLIEAGFLSARVSSPASEQLHELAQQLLIAHATQKTKIVEESSARLMSACTSAWRAYWKAKRY